MDNFLEDLNLKHPAQRFKDPYLIARTERLDYDTT
jgi:hypothetical protein